MRSQSETVRLAELKEERAVLERRKAGLLRQLAEVEGEILRNDIDQAEFAPVYMLPEDVLKQIFEETYAHNPIDGPCQLESSSSLIPLQVSRRWRYTALSLPQIWRCIHLDISVPFVEHCLQQLSPHSPIFIFGNDVAHKLKIDRCTQSLDLLLNRPWLFYDVRSHDESLVRILIRALSNAKTSLLRHLNVEYLRSQAYPPLTYDGSSPVPPSVHCSHLGLRAVDVPLVLPALANLRSLFLGNYRLDDEDFQRIANAAIKLEELTLDTVEVPFDGTGTSRVVTFPQLTKLKFVLMHWDDSFYYLDLPRLHTVMSLKGPIMHLDEPTPAKIYPSVRHFKYVQCVAEGGLYDVDPFDGDIFRRYPNVTALDLIDCTCIKHVLNYFAYADGADGVLPKLEVLSFELSWTALAQEDIHPESILRLVERRVHSGSPLKELRLGQASRTDIGSHILEQLSQLVTVSDRPLTAEERLDVNWRHRRTV